MNPLHTGWPSSFTNGLKYLVKLDRQSLDHPIYTIRSDELYRSVSAEVRAAFRAALGDTDISAVTLDDLYYHYTRRRRGVPELNFFCSLVEEVCADLIIAENIYDTECLFFCLLCVQDRDEDARRFFHKLLRPAVAIYRLTDAYNVIGLRGGRHRSAYYVDASVLAHQYRRRHPDARDTETAAYIYSCFSVNESSIPSKETIRRWLREF